MEDINMQLKNNLWNILINLLRWDPEDKEDPTFVNLLATSGLEIDYIVLLSKEELRNHHSHAEKTLPNLSFRIVSRIYFLPFCLKHLQEKGEYSFCGEFDYFSINESEVIKFKRDLDDISMMKSRIDILPDLPSSENRNSSALPLHIEKYLVDSSNQDNLITIEEEEGTIKEEGEVKSNDKSSNEKSTFEHPLVEPPSKLDIKHVLVKEEFLVKGIFRGKEHA